MKLAFSTLLVAGVELAMLANVGRAHHTSGSPESHHLSTRDAGFDVAESLFMRSIYDSDLSDISTRALVSELQERLYRRGDRGEEIKKLKKALAKYKNSSKASDKSKIKAIEQQLVAIMAKDAQKKADKKAKKANKKAGQQGAMDQGGALPAGGAGEGAEAMHGGGEAAHTAGAGAGAHDAPPADVPVAAEEQIVS